MSAEHTNFLMIGAGRCGSNMLFTALRDHPDVYCDGEVLKKPYLDRIGSTYGREFARVFGADASARGCKLFFHHMNRKDPRWKWFIRNAVILHPIRTDLVEWHVSMQAARSNDAWSPRSRDAVPSLSSRRVSMDLPFFRRKVKEYRGNIEWARRTFSPERYMEIDYRDLCRDWTGSMERIQTFLGVDPVDLCPDTVKQNSEPVRDRIVNYGDVEYELASMDTEVEIMR